MDYELAKKLKDAGFTQTHKDITLSIAKDMQSEECLVPTLSELIEACGNVTIRLQSYWNGNDLMWQADTCGNFRDYDHVLDKSEVGSTPEEAVANLWLALNTNK